MATYKKGLSLWIFKEICIIEERFWNKYIEYYARLTAYKLCDLGQIIHFL